MRYRPLGNTGMSVSAISLVLTDSNVRSKPSDWVPLIYAGLECGINAFEVAGHQPALIDGFAEALQVVDRNLVFVAWRLGWAISANGVATRDFSPAGLAHTVEAVIARTGLEYLDTVILDDPHSEELLPQALDVLKELREMGSIRLLGVAGNDEATDAYISSGAFDLVATTFSLTSGWKERLRLKAAIDRDMAVIGYDYYPDTVREHQRALAAQRTRTAANPLAGVGSFAFLDHTQRWTSEEICLAYAMTEPSLCSVQVHADRIDQIETLAAVPERELPPNVPAQIEMARFAPALKAAPAEQIARRA
jgi:aryl-alcohol dehydrogenase-like predicted oxidoreductase